MNKIPQTVIHNRWEDSNNSDEHHHFHSSHMLDSLLAGLVDIHISSQTHGAAVVAHPHLSRIGVGHSRRPVAAIAIIGILISLLEE